MNLISKLSVFLYLFYFEVSLTDAVGGLKRHLLVDRFLGKESNEEPIFPAPPRPEYTPDEWQELELNYLAIEKIWPYVGSEIYLSQMEKATRQYYNSLAVFPNQRLNRLHGTVGLYPNGTRIYMPGPEPPPITSVNEKESLKNGGFYLALSDHLPLDRDPPDFRASVCKKANYDLKSLDDVSVVITFYNEPFSTLMRSVHAVLNRTPPPLLREIILVDDCSNSTIAEVGGMLDKYMRFLPKVKLMRMPERRGLVMARLAGAKVARAPVLVVLDSHIEVNDQWLEPLLERLSESPQSIVFPQILSIDSSTFSYTSTSGIGCHVSFKWIMQESSKGPITATSTKAIPSPTMAGGLFAVRIDWFENIGRFDEEFTMWGAENLEISFRSWMCGGRIECAPCALTYHIYRKSGVGYSSPHDCIRRNRLRTARIWTDELYQLSSLFLATGDIDVGPVDEMLELKKKLNCKTFQWFLEHVDKTQPIRTLKDISEAGEIRNQAFKQYCIDTLSNTKAGLKWGVFFCHGSGGSQGFVRNSKSKQIHLVNNEMLCLASNMEMQQCNTLHERIGRWDITEKGQLMTSFSNECLTMIYSNESHSLELQQCNEANKAQLWTFKSFQPDPNFKLLDFSPQYKANYLNDSLKGG